MNIDDITILIKTFQRYTTLQKCILSIRNLYPNIKIHVLDDSIDFKADQIPIGVDKYIITTPDIGLPQGRNVLMKSAESSLVFVTDDDHIFTDKVCLEKAIQIIEEGFDIVGPSDVNLYRLRMHCNMQYKEPFAYYKGYPIYHFVENFFLANANSLRDISFRENDMSKIGGEHGPFFAECMLAGLRITADDCLTLTHDKTNNDNQYKQYRQRVGRAPDELSNGWQRYWNRNRHKELDFDHVKTTQRLHDSVIISTINSIPDNIIQPQCKR